MAKDGFTVQEVSKKTGLAPAHCQAFLAALLAIQPQARLSYTPSGTHAGLKTVGALVSDGSGFTGVVLEKDIFGQARVTVGDQAVVLSESVNQRRRGSTNGAVVVTANQLRAALKKELANSDGM